MASNAATNMHIVLTDDRPVERKRLSAEDIDALAPDRSRFSSRLLDQVSRMHARESGLVEDEARLTRKRDRLDDVTPLEALRTMLSKGPSLAALRAQGKSR